MDHPIVILALVHFLGVIETFAILLILYLYLPRNIGLRSGQSGPEIPQSSARRPLGDYVPDTPEDNSVIYLSSARDEENLSGVAMERPPTSDGLD